MTSTETNTRSTLETRRRYRRLSGACLVVGILAYFAAIRLDYIVLGTLVYWAGFLGMIAIWQGTSIDLYDEREQLLDLRAGGWTLGIFAFVLVFGAPGLVALESTGSYEAPPELWGAMFGYAALFAVYGVIYTVHRYRS